MDIFGTEPHAILTMDHRDEARAEELDNLRLALATFAVQLDAFEMCTGGGPLRTGIEPAIRVPPPDAGYRLAREKMQGRKIIGRQ